MRLVALTLRSCVRVCYCRSYKQDFWAATVMISVLIYDPWGQVLDVLMWYGDCEWR